MGNECGSDKIYNFETTVIRCQNDVNSDIIRIYCDPMPGNDNLLEDYFILERNGPDFITLYNKIELRETYNIEFRRYGTIPGETQFAFMPGMIFGIPQFGRDTQLYEITEIASPIVRTGYATVVGFLNISLEFPKMQDYEEVMVKPHLQNRLLIKKSEKQNMDIGKLYHISYVKFCGSNLFHIESWKLAHEFSCSVSLKMH